MTSRMHAVHGEEDAREFGRKIRRFHESLAHKERRMLRDVISAALAEEGMDVAGFASMDDDALFAALERFLGTADGAMA